DGCHIPCGRAAGALLVWGARIPGHRGLLDGPDLVVRAGAWVVPRMPLTGGRAGLGSVSPPGPRGGRFCPAGGVGWWVPRSPARSARAAACTRLVTASLRKMLVTCTAAVDRLMNSSPAIWALLRPAATSRSTASSRPVRAYGAGACAGGGSAAVVSSG